MKKEELELLSNDELNTLLRARGLAPLAEEDRETAIDLIVQLSNQS